MYAVYVKTDEENRIVAVTSSAFLPDGSGWVEIDRGEGDRYHHAQGHYLAREVTDERGISRYRLAEGKPVERAQEEMDADWVEPTPQPDVRQRIEALEEELAAARIVLGVE